MLAVIGGTGLYQIESLQMKEALTIETPFGLPSAPIIKADYQGTPVCFLPRHGEHHHLLPHEVNYRANIWALKSIGVTHVLAVSAVGSLQEAIRPGEFVVVEQYIDLVQGNRIKSFFGDGLVVHASPATPASHPMAKQLRDAVIKEGNMFHIGKTYGCIDGPRFNTAAESKRMKQMGCDVVGMTNVPEVFLAREAQIAYVALAIPTDYDSWKDDASAHVTVDQVMERYGKSIKRAENVVLQFIHSFSGESDDPARSSLSHAILTPEDAWTDEHKALLAILKS